MADGSVKSDAVAIVTLRIPENVLGQVDEMLAELRTSDPLAANVSRNVLLVVLISRGLAATLENA